MRTANRTTPVAAGTAGSLHYRGVDLSFCHRNCRFNLLNCRLAHVPVALDGSRSSDNGLRGWAVGLQMGLSKGSIKAYEWNGSRL
ncbi:hypothetical protein T4B_6722 [Trichinella pseudospiralis]|uniref:Uncharacterized protein n=1 Tax=Trichinella pseudospiralis TaxID=6337 RepID=A0A0V1JBW5_TRIPS|nr:hypothetical protein T4B_6722 [Trichinella pseudospiralis]KRZ45893.1 hypothetical protein T4C_14151 [Trichinella pseudospiralis]